MNPMNDKFLTLAKGRYGKVLIEVLNDVMREVADIRKDLVNVKPELQNLVRLGVIQIIQEKVVDRLKVKMGELQPGDPNEHI